MNTSFTRKKELHWEVADKLTEHAKLGEILATLMDLRGLKTTKQKEEFLHPPLPISIGLSNLGIKKRSSEMVIRRILKALKKDESVVVYGDYDADGICATAILWETLHVLGMKVKPYLPDRFSEGYGLNEESIRKLKENDPKLSLIITVDNGIVAHGAVTIAKALGIDVVITDHHTREAKLPEAYAILHTTLTSGAGLAWFLANEIRRTKEYGKELLLGDGLDLAAIGTIADQVPLIGVNRSIVKYGLLALNTTRRPGIIYLLKETGIKGSVGVYEVGFILAPRINAMGRLEHAIDSLRFVCTSNEKRARELSSMLFTTNTQRQKIVEEVVIHAKNSVSQKDWPGVIVVSDESYHEGIIGLAASKIVEEYYRPAIMISRGKDISKASARSIPGFNIIENIRKVENYILGGGGHPMAAGFSIETVKIGAFMDALDKVASPLLTEEILRKRLRIDSEIPFNIITKDLVEGLRDFEPSGIGNPTPVFATRNVTVLDAHPVGKEAKHLKMVVEKDGKVYDAIGFNFGSYYQKLTPDALIDIAYTIEENEWNNRKMTQLKVKDIIIK